MGAFTPTAFPDNVTITYNSSNLLQANGTISGTIITIPKTMRLDGTAYNSGVAAASLSLDMMSSAGVFQNGLMVFDGGGDGINAPNIILNGTVSIANGGHALFNSCSILPVGFNSGVAASNLQFATYTSAGAITTAFTIGATTNSKQVTTANNTLDDGTTGNITAAGFVRVQSASSIYSGSGVPSFSANAGDLYIRTNGAVAGTCVYYNTASGNHWSATSA